MALTLLLEGLQQAEQLSMWDLSFKLSQLLLQKNSRILLAELQMKVVSEL
jgi:hypothetical protein